ARNTASRAAVVGRGTGARFGAVRIRHRRLVDAALAVLPYLRGRRSGDGLRGRTQATVTSGRDAADNRRRPVPRSTLSARAECIASVRPLLGSAVAGLCQRRTGPLLLASPHRRPSSPRLYPDSSFACLN